MEETKPLIYGALALVAFVALRKGLSSSKEEEVPTLGSSGFLSSYRDGWKFLNHASELLQQGYDQYPDRVFRIARPFNWEYVVCAPKLINEVGNAPENVLSFNDAVNEAIQIKITMGREVAENPYHVTVVRTGLTRNLHRCFPAVRDEIICAFDDVLKLDGDNWKTLTVLPAMMEIVARVSNRLFVGLPLCRDKGYLENNVQFTLDVFRSANRINRFPPFLRPIVGPYISNRKNSFKAALRYLGPVLEERFAKENELGPDWPGKPNDFISWMLEVATPEERTVDGFVTRLLSINMAAIHTSSMTFTHALFDLIVHPEYLQPLREEVESVVKEEGWNKAALSNMVKIDSFLRESQRLHSLGIVSMSRKVVSKDGLRLSDGSFLPYGSILCVPSQATHYDDANYENPTVFDGFRFSRERTEHKQTSSAGTDNIEIFKRHMVSTAVDHLPFGNGKHACPGRFFAATELKAMFAHMVLNYDVKAEVEGVRPPDNVFGTTVNPCPTGRVLIKKRH